MSFNSNERLYICGAIRAMMTVRDLCGLLLTYPGEMLVVLSVDAEGNEHRTVADVSVGEYTPETSWSGEFNSYIDSAGTRRRTASESNALCIWPTN
jgi:hypothetical protein